MDFSGKKDMENKGMGKEKNYTLNLRQLKAAQVNLESVISLHFIVSTVETKHSFIF